MPEDVGTAPLGDDLRREPPAICPACSPSSPGSPPRPWGWRSGWREGPHPLREVGLRLKVAARVCWLAEIAQVGLQPVGSQQKVGLLPVGALGPQHPLLQVAVVQVPGRPVAGGRAGSGAPSPCSLRPPTPPVTAPCPPRPVSLPQGPRTLRAPKRGRYRWTCCRPPAAEKPGEPDFGQGSWDPGLADLVYSRLLRDRPLSSANFPTHTGSRAPGKNKFRSSNTTTSDWPHSTGQPRSLPATCLFAPPRLFQNLPPHQLSAWGGLWGPRPTCTCSGGSWDTGPAYPPPLWGRPSICIFPHALVGFSRESRPRNSEGGPAGVPAWGPFPPGWGTSSWARRPEQEEAPLTEESADPPAHTWETPP